VGASLATVEDVSRLFARVAFGATPVDVAQWVGHPYDEVVEHLLSVPAQPPTDLVGGALSDAPSGDPSLAQRSWLEVMRTTQYPLLERMTLLWHGHFATAVAFDGSPTIDDLLRQNATIRRHAMGNFRALLAAMTVDPAMLYWLNGAENTSKKPNENYAREFFELFTLGRSPQVHNEQDVREAARLLTGWTVTGTGAAQFVPARHDAGSKTVLGRRIDNGGPQEYWSLVDLVVGHPVAPRFIASKLVAGLAYVPASTDLLAAPDPLVAAVADALTRSNWDIRTALRVLLLSNDFRYGPPRHVRPPVDLVVAGCKALGITAQDSRTTQALGPMGQLPFQPPNVGGWPVGPAWLSATTMLARYDWGHLLFSASRDHLSVAPPARDLEGWAHQLGMADLSPNTRSALDAYLASRPNAQSEELQEGVLSLLLASPDWMVA